MGFLDSVKAFFGRGVSNAYNGVKDVIGKVYTPIHSAIKTVGSIADKVDDVVNQAKGSGIPLISQAAASLQNHPYYQTAKGAIKEAGQIDDTARQIGNAIDSVVSPLANTVDKTFHLGNYASTPQGKNSFPQG
jgi:phage-related protein